MISKTTKDFQNEVLNNMTFKPYKTENYTIYKNENKPELGYFIKYSREGYYDFGIGDYTIPVNFSISFEHHELSTQEKHNLKLKIILFLPLVPLLFLYLKKE